MNRDTDRSDIPIESNLRRAYRTPPQMSDPAEVGVEFETLLARLAQAIDARHQRAGGPDGRRL